MKNLNFFKPLIIIIVFFSFFSCENNDEPIVNSENLLIGNWSNAVYEGEKITFKRVADLPSEAYGVCFKDEDVYIERSSGFCGTPPLTFFNTEGTWQTLKTNLIKVNLQDYPGNFNWRIISLTEKKLLVKREITEQEEDYRALMNLFYEIEDLANSISCSNSNNWVFTIYGSKACGGPQGFIAYSTDIDTVAFLQKVANYTEKERLYNIKWGIISTCDVPNQPTSIECQNGFPILKY